MGHKDNKHTHKKKLYMQAFAVLIPLWAIGGCKFNVLSLK